MIPAFVVDASMTLSWFVEDEYTETTKALRQEVVSGGVPWVPMLWPLEVTNGLLVIFRRGRISESKLWEIHGLLKALPVEMEEHSPKQAFEESFRLAQTHKLTAYDATYLDLARRKALPLATLDKPVRGVAKKIGVVLLPEDL